MAAPSPTTRVSPAGIKLKDGYRSLITFSLDSNIDLWEKKVTPPGLDGREKINQTTMWNDDFITYAPRSLTDMTDSSMTCAYDPVAYTQIQAIINREGTVTQTFSDGSTLAYYGYLQKFEPQELDEGTQPEAKVTIVCTNFDPVNHVEAAPVLTSVSGT